jgi:hypothetical protein
MHSAFLLIEASFQIAWLKKSTQNTVLWTKSGTKYLHLERRELD